MRQIKTNYNVPTKYQHVQEFDIDKYHVLFNAKANMYSMAVLNQKEYSFYSAINGKKKLTQLSTETSSDKADKSLNSMLHYLEQKNIIHFLQDEPLVDVSPSKSAAIWLHVTNQCNLRCTYCYIKKTNEHLDTDKGKIYAEKAFKVLKKQGMESVNVMLAGGEPTLRFGQTMTLVNYLRECGKKYGLEVEITLLTNGTLINPSKAKLLRDEGINVSVSLDGIDESNNKNRPYINGKGSLNKVLSGIAMLRDFGVNINISVVITPETIDHFPKVIEYCLKHNIRYIIQFARENTFSIGDVQADNERLIEGMRGVFEIIRNNFPTYSLLEGHLDNVSFSRAHSEPVCGVDNNYIVISDKGEVSSCHMLMDKPVGSILDVDIGDKLFTEQPLTNGITSEQKEDCNICKWRYVCAGSCPATTKLTYGTAGKKSPFCQAYKVLIPELLQLEAQRIIALAS